MPGCRPSGLRSTNPYTAPSPVAVRVDRHNTHAVTRRRRGGVRHRGHPRRYTQKIQGTGQHGAAAHSTRGRTLCPHTSGRLRGCLAGRHVICVHALVRTPKFAPETPEHMSQQHSPDLFPLLVPVSCFPLRLPARSYVRARSAPLTHRGMPSSPLSRGRKDGGVHGDPWGDGHTLAGARVDPAADDGVHVVREGDLVVELRASVKVDGAVECVAHRVE